MPSSPITHLMGSFPVLEGSTVSVTICWCFREFENIVHKLSSTVMISIILDTSAVSNGMRDVSVVIDSEDRS